MPETHFDEWIAERYQILWPELFDPAVIDPPGLLCSAGRYGPSLELGIGIGRIALPLSRRGVRVHGIDLSAAWSRSFDGEKVPAAIDVTIGDFSTTRPGGTVQLVYLLRNTSRNLTSQEEQI
jgi:hypothetical protein